MLSISLAALTHCVGLAYAQYNGHSPFSWAPWNPPDSHNLSGVADAQVLDHPFPYYFPQDNGTVADLFAMPDCKGVKIEDATIDELQQHLSAGRLTSVDLVMCYLQRNFQTTEYIKLVPSFSRV